MNNLNIKVLTDETFATTVEKDNIREKKFFDLLRKEAKDRPTMCFATQFTVKEESVSLLRQQPCCDYQVQCGFSKVVFVPGGVSLAESRISRTRQTPIYKEAINSGTLL